MKLGKSGLDPIQDPNMKDWYRDFDPDDSQHIVVQQQRMLHMVVNTILEGRRLYNPILGGVYQEWRSEIPSLTWITEDERRAHVFFLHQTERIQVTDRGDRAAKFEKKIRIAHNLAKRKQEAGGTNKNLTRTQIQNLKGRTCFPSYHCALSQCPNEQQ